MRTCARIVRKQSPAGCADHLEDGQHRPMIIAGDSGSRKAAVIVRNGESGEAGL
jgi:hypothetical protein